MEVLGILGVGDEHCRPLLKLQVREAEHIVVHGQNSVPAGEMRTVSDSGNWFKKKSAETQISKIRSRKTCNKIKTLIK